MFSNLLDDLFEFIVVDKFRKRTGEVFLIEVWEGVLYYRSGDVSDFI